jgi:hypothetical protein
MESVGNVLPAQRLIDRYKFRGALDGQRPDQNGIDDAERGGVGADAEGEREDGDEGEARVLAEPPEGQTEVEQQTVHGGFCSKRSTGVKVFEGKGLVFGGCSDLELGVRRRTGLVKW